MGDGETYHVSIDSVYVKYIRFNLKVPCRRHVCNCSLINSISHVFKNVYDVSVYKISYS